MSHEGFKTSELAKRYASALFSLAEENDALDAVAADLNGLRAMIQDSDDLRSLISSPLLSRQDQQAGLLAVLDKAGTHDLVKQFFGVVASKRRLFAAEAMIQSFLEELALKRGEKSATVITAKKLTATQLKALEETFKKSVEGTVNIQQEVDSALIGGMIVKFGSRMVDDSIRTKLAKLELSMKGLA